MNNYYISPAKEAKNFIRELIIDYRYKNYFQLSKSDKSNLASILSKSYRPQDEIDFISETDPHYLMNLFRGYLMTKKESSKEMFLEAMEDTLINYYDKTMKELFEDYQQEIEYDIEHAA